MPWQTELLPVIAGVGNGFTTVDAVVLPVQPFKLVTVTVNVEEAEGVMVCVVAPLDHK